MSDTLTPESYFQVWIAQDSSSNLLSLPGHFHDEASVSGRSNSSESRENMLRTHIHVPCTMAAYEGMVASSVILRQMIRRANSVQSNYIILTPEPSLGIDAGALRFMVENLAYNSARFGGRVHVEDLVKQTNALSRYQCDIAAFVNGWDLIPARYKSSSRTSRAERGSRRTRTRCWWQQQAGTAVRPLRLLNIAWVLGRNHSSMNRYLEVGIRTAVWDSNQFISTSVGHIGNTEGKMLSICGFPADANCII
jgi:hypothetical protein